VKEVWLIIGLVGLIAGIIVIVKKGVPLLLQYRAKKKETLPSAPPPIPAAAHGAAKQKKSERAKSWVSVVTYGLLVLALTGWVVTWIRDSEVDRPRREEILQAKFALVEAQKRAIDLPSRFSVIAPTIGWSESVIRPDDYTAYSFSVPQGMGRWIECWEDGRISTFGGESHPREIKFRSLVNEPIAISVLRQVKQ